MKNIIILLTFLVTCGSFQKNVLALSSQTSSINSDGNLGLSAPIQSPKSDSSQSYSLDQRPLYQRISSPTVSPVEQPGIRPLFKTPIARRVVLNGEKQRPLFENIFYQTPPLVALQEKEMGDDKKKENKSLASKYSDLGTGELFAVSMTAAVAETTITFPLRALKIDQMIPPSTSAFAMVGSQGSIARMRQMTGSMSRGFVSTFATGLMRQGTMFFVGPWLMSSPSSPLSSYALPAAIATGILAATISSPGGVLLSQARKHPEINVSGISRRIWRTEGPTGFFRGYVPLAGKTILAAVGFFYLPKMLDSSFDSDWGAVAASGVITAAITQPLDDIKVAMQLAPKGTPMIKATRDMVQKRGMRGFVTGLIPRVINTGIGFMTASAVMNGMASLFSK